MLIANSAFDQYFFLKLAPYTELSICAKNSTLMKNFPKVPFPGAGHKWVNFPNQVRKIGSYIFIWNSGKVDAMKLWKSHEENNRLSNWTHTCKMILVQPSSAAAECVFSILNIFSSQQKSPYKEDYIELSL